MIADAKHAAVICSISRNTGNPAGPDPTTLIGISRRTMLPLPAVVVKLGACKNTQLGTSFVGSVLENIRFGLTSASEEQIIEAAKKANAWEFISTFPEGLLTEVGDRGIQLSGGQKQRIAIARALLKNPVILILDEATSALDSESERLVQEALEVLMKGRTSLVIAHRLATIRNASQILVLQDGKIKESGTHKELIAQKGVYADFVAMQTMEI